MNKKQSTISKVSMLSIPYFVREFFTREEASKEYRCITAFNKNSFVIKKSLAFLPGDALDKTTRNILEKNLQKYAGAWKTLANR